MSHAHDVTPGTDPALRGIGGWLILMAIGQVLGPIQILVGMIKEYGGLPEGTFARFPLAFVGDATMRLAFVGFLAYVAFLFFNTRREFPGRFIQTYIAGLLLPFAIGIWVTVTSGVNTLGNLASSEFFWTYVPGLVIGALWVAYVLNSERVRNTFVD